MKLSVVMPTHGVGPRININILNACSMGTDDVEVVIRDNSGNDEKRKFLSQIHEKNCRIISVDECPGVENHKSSLEEAKGEFVFFICDDDSANSYALAPIFAEIERIRDDSSIIGTTGLFIMEEDAASRVVRFNHFDKPTPLERFQGFFQQTNHSIFQYSPLRRSVMQEVWSYLSTMPVHLSYDDVIMNCLFLMHGRLTYVDRYLYQYINANWSNPAMCLKSDAHYFKLAGLDTSGVRLQWLFAIFEGAQTFVGKYKGVHLPHEQRYELASFWIKHWFPHFAYTAQRYAEDGKFDAQAIQVANKWLQPREIKLQELLTDMAEFLSLSSPSVAERYYEFWR